jgi:AhpD family alkylhydroperoxidase
VAIYAHAPGLLVGYGMLERAFAGAKRVDERLKTLAEVKAAALIGCEFCVDIASHKGHEAGLTDEQLLALPRYSESELFSALEKLVLDYAVAVTRTPVKVEDELFARLRGHFDDAQLVELTTAIVLENYRARFNWAFDIGSAGFTEGMVCAVPEANAEPISAASAGAM